MLKRQEEMGEKRMAVKCKMGLLMGTLNGTARGTLKYIAYFNIHSSCPFFLYSSRHIHQ